MGRIFWFAIGAFAGVWWMKHKEDKQLSYYYRRRRDAIADDQTRPNLRNDHEKFEVVAKITDADKERLRELGSQATEVASELGESLIETAFSALESLRVRMAEQKERRELREQFMKDKSEEKHV